MSEIIIQTGQNLKVLTIKEKILLGVKHTDIARDLGVTDINIYQIQRRLIEKGEITAEEIERVRVLRREIKKLLKRGDSVIQIADMLGITENYVKEFAESINEYNELVKILENNVKQRKNRKTKRNSKKIKVRRNQKANSCSLTCDGHKHISNKKKVSRKRRNI